MQKLPLFLLAATASLAVFAPARTVEQTSASIRYVTIVDEEGIAGHCTAWSPRIKQWMTANHCVEGTMSIGADVLRIIAQDEKTDLALLEGPIAPPLTIADTDPLVSSEATLIGWPEDYPAESAPLPFFGRIQALNITVPGVGAHRTLIHEGGGKGMSGGPIVDSAGHVIGMVEAIHMWPSTTMISQSVGQIKKFLEIK